jgi:16S rRNA (cytidine1402-2'-O)-methyltransferase
MSRAFLVPTPIGNLRDITFRAVEVLGQADLILAEDTGRPENVGHYKISSPLQSHHMFNEHKSVEAICKKIASGINVALISMQVPGISIRDFCLSGPA